jgi:hypothetical protein
VLQPESVLWDTRHLIEGSKGVRRSAMESYEKGDFGGWELVLKDDRAFVGTCGIDVGYAPEHARAELGYVLSREHWGNGLIPEAVRAGHPLQPWAHGDQPRRGRCTAENIASARVHEYKTAQTLVPRPAFRRSTRAASNYHTPMDRQRRTMKRVMGSFSILLT